MFLAEMMKVKRTPFFWLHLLFPLLGAGAFICYFAAYGSQEETTRLRLILDIIMTVFPILCSVVTGMAVQQEEASCFYGILAREKRGSALLVKLVFLWGMGTAATVLLYLGMGVGIRIFSGENLAELLWSAALGTAVWGLVPYTFHLFLNLKFGMGVSVFFGVFESLQVIVYSNIELAGVFRYIPFAWQIDWAKDAVSRREAEHAAEWGLCLVLSAVFVFLLALWFRRWEGRRNYET